MAIKDDDYSLYYLGILHFSNCTTLFAITVYFLTEAMILPGYQTGHSVSSSNFHHLALLALPCLWHQGDTADLNFAILYMIIV